MRPSSILSARIRSYIHEGNAVLRKEVSYAPYQKSIEAAYYRGGTSRAVIFQPHHLPTDRARWPSIFRQIMGSGDPFKRQLDGMGAGISSLSKICLVEPYSKRLSSKAASPRSGSESEFGNNLKHEGSERPVDIDYTFVGLGIENTEVDVAGNCGNMSSAIGPYAYNAGLLGPLFYACGDGQVTVTIRNTNTGKIIESTFEVQARQAVVTGSFKIDGVATPGSKIRLDFQRPYGSKTGKVLPTGKRIDDIKGFRVTCVDGANPAVFIRADDIKVDGTILPEDFNKLPERLDLLEQIRKAAAVAMGIAPNEDLVPRTIPKIGLVSQSTTHPVLSGQTIATRDTDIVVRFLSDTQPHRAIPLTAALTTAVAARIPGTVVEQLLSPEPAMQNLITIGHASGRLRVNATMDAENQTLPVTASVYRTAKRLFEGKIFYNDISPLEEEPGTKYTSGGNHSLGMAFVLESRGKSSKDLYEHDAQEPKQKKSKDPKEVSVAGFEHETEKESWKTISYRQAEPTAEDLMVTPITRAVIQLRNHLNTMLRDPELITAYHRLPLVQQLSETYERLIHPSLKRKYKSRGTEWHKFAEKLHKRQRPLREQAEKESRREGMYAQGYRRTTKATLGLDKHGFLKNQRGTVVDDEVS